MLTLKGRTCVIGGGTGAVGRGAVRAMCQNGMNVVLGTHMVEDARSLVEELKDCEGKCVAVSAKMIFDIVTENGVNKLVEIPVEEGAFDGNVKFAYDRFGSIDVVISNTGAFDAPLPLEEISDEELTKKLNHQVVGAFRSVMSALPYLKKSKAGRILLMASAGARNGFTGEYFCDSVARGAVISMTYALARELLPCGITVNCIAKSGMVNDHEPHGRVLDMNTLVPQIPVGRIGTADEFGAAVQYLVSEEAGFVTGQVIDLSGGLAIGS